MGNLDVGIQVAIYCIGIVVTLVLGIVGKLAYDGLRNGKKSNGNGNSKAVFQNEQIFHCVEEIKGEIRSHNDKSNAYSEVLQKITYTLERLSDKQDSYRDEINKLMELRERNHTEYLKRLNDLFEIVLKGK